MNAAADSTPRQSPKRAEGSLRPLATCSPAIRDKAKLMFVEAFGEVKPEAEAHPALAFDQLLVADRLAMCASGLAINLLPPTAPEAYWCVADEHAARRFYEGEAEARAAQIEAFERKRLADAQARREAHERREEIYRKEHQRGLDALWRTFAERWPTVRGVIRAAHDTTVDVNALSNVELLDHLAHHFAVELHRLQQGHGAIDEEMPDYAIDALKLKRYVPTPYREPEE